MFQYLSKWRDSVILFTLEGHSKVRHSQNDIFYPLPPILQIAISFSNPFPRDPSYNHCAQLYMP